MKRGKFRKTISLDKMWVEIDGFFSIKGVLLTCCQKYPVDFGIV